MSSFKQLGGKAKMLQHTVALCSVLSSENILSLLTEGFWLQSREYIMNCIGYVHSCRDWGALIIGGWAYRLRCRADFRSNKHGALYKTCYKESSLCGVLRLFVGHTPIWHPYRIRLAPTYSFMKSRCFSSIPNPKP